MPSEKGGDTNEELPREEEDVGGRMRTRIED